MPGKGIFIVNQDDLRTINIHGWKKEFVAIGFNIGDGTTLVTI